MKYQEALPGHVISFVGETAHYVVDVQSQAYDLDKQTKVPTYWCYMVGHYGQPSWRRHPHPFLEIGLVNSEPKAWTAFRAPDSSSASHWVVRACHSIAHDDYAHLELDLVNSSGQIVYPNPPRAEIRYWEFDLPRDQAERLRVGDQISFDFHTRPIIKMIDSQAVVVPTDLGPHGKMLIKLTAIHRAAYYEVSL